MKFITNFLCFALIGILAIVLFMSVLIGLEVLPNMIRTYPDNTWAFYTIALGIYTSVVFFGFGLYQAFRLIRNFEKSETFTQNTIGRLNKIKFAAFSIGVLYVLGSPFAYLLAQLEDAPGLIIIEMIFGGLSFTVAAFALLSQKVISSGMTTKKEQQNSVVS